MPYLHYKCSINRSIKFVRSPLTLTPIEIPIFYQSQSVIFDGGSGIIRSCKSEAGIWNYLVEMASGSQPTGGRIWAKTMVVLHEADLQAV